MTYSNSVSPMLCNAFNNWSKAPARVTAMPKDQVEKVSELLEGYHQVISLDQVDRSDLILAMEEYYATTDWSAFKRKDWQAAWDFLFTPSSTVEG